MYTAGVEIRRRDAHAFIHLMLDAGSRFYGGGRIQPGLRAIVGRQRKRFLCGAVRRRSIGIGLNGLHLSLLVEVVAVYIEQKVIGVSIEENSISGAQDCFWWLSSAPKAVGKRNPRAKIGFVRNVVLRLEAQPVAEGKVGSHLPVVLSVKAQIDYAYALGRNSGGDGKLTGLVCRIVIQIGIGIGAHKVRIGIICVVRIAQPPTET